MFFKWTAANNRLSTLTEIITIIAQLVGYENNCDNDKKHMQWNTVDVKIATSILKVFTWLLYFVCDFITVFSRNIRIVIGLRRVSSSIVWYAEKTYLKLFYGDFTIKQTTKMMSQNGAPILVLNTNTKRRFGHKVQIENIAAGDYQFFYFPI